jgi:hypothetical protein
LEFYHTTNLEEGMCGVMVAAASPAVMALKRWILEY